MFDELLYFRNAFNTLKRKRKKTVPNRKVQNPYENEMAAVILAAVGTYLNVNPVGQTKIIAVSNETYNANENEITAVISAAVGMYLTNK